MKILTDLCPSAELQNLIDICKSNSKITGRELRNAHYRLGVLIGDFILQDCKCGEDITVLSLLRSGLCFGEGIADVLDCTHLVLDEKHDRRWQESENNEFIMEYHDYIFNRTVILTDAVINSGDTIQKVYDAVSAYARNVIVAANVIQESYNPGTKTVYTIRVSKNKFKGSKVQVQVGNQGPDTGDRLYLTL